MSSRLRLLLKTCVSLVIIVVLWHTVPFGDALTALATVDPAMATAGLVLAMAIIPAGAGQIHAVTHWQGLSISAAAHVKITLQTGFYALFLPGAISGGAVRWYKLARPDGKPAEAMSGIVFNRMIGMVAGVGLGLACWLAAGPVGLRAPVGLVFVGALAGLAGMYATAFNRRLYAWLARRTPAGVRERVPDALRQKVRRTLAAMTAFEGMPAGVKATVLGWAIVKHLIGIAAFVAFVTALGSDVSYVNAGWVRALTSMLLLLPISVAGIGVRESATIVLLAPLGVPAATALALSFVFLARDLAFGLVGGVLEGRDTFLARDGRGPASEPAGSLHAKLSDRLADPDSSANS